MLAKAPIVVIENYFRKDEITKDIADSTPPLTNYFKN